MNLLNTLFPNPETSFPLIAVILGLPALGAFVNGVFGKRLGPQGVTTMALAAIFGSLAASLLAFAVLYARIHGVETAGAEAEAGQHTENVRLVWNAWRWLAVDRAAIDVAFSIDTLSAVMLLVVTGVGGIIHLYAVGYMHGDPSYHRFFAYMNLFILAMLVLVLGDSLPILFIGWEGVGLCSYLLIGFWFESEKNASAGKKAFITNRVGDFGLLVAMAMLLDRTGSLSWKGMASGEAASALLKPIQIWPLGSGLPQFIVDLAAPLGNLNAPWLVSGATLVALALFLGCAGKSAQIPLYVWLPDAMAGPTPVSALIHAATMVTAGVYLVARMGFVFVLSPSAMMVVAGVGALTALFAATIGLVQNDIKKVLAYSTVSQLGYMFMAVGVGAFAAGIFHVFTHAFFKACLFLCAGSVIHSMHARIHDTDRSQDMRHMGGLKRFMPVTFWTYLFATAAIIGTPLLSGFWSKDEILFRTWVNRIHPDSRVVEQALRTAMQESGGTLTQEARQAIADGLVTPTWFHQALFVVGVLAAVLTAFYMIRSLVLTFLGDFRGWQITPGWHDPHEGHDHDEHHEETPEAPLKDGPVPKESPWPMTVPLIILAFFAVVAGALNMGVFHLKTFEHWLDRTVASAGQIKLVRTVVESRGAEQTAEQIEHALFALEKTLLFPGILAFALGTTGAIWVYYIKKGEPARQAIAASPKFHRLVLEKWRIDELYEATVIAAVDSLAETAALFDKYVVDGILATLTAKVVQSFGSLFRAFQTGRVQMYAAVLVIGLLAMGAYFAAPHNEVVVNLDRASGQYVVRAAPGLGYQYRWDVNSDGKWDTEEWTSVQEIKVRVAPNDTKTVSLEVRNAFKFVTQQTIELKRPPPDRSKPTPMGLMDPTLDKPKPKGVQR